MEKITKEETPGPKEFGFKVLEFKRELGFVPIEYNGQIYKLYLREDDGKTVLFRNGDPSVLTKEARQAMKDQAWAILHPVWLERKAKLGTIE